MSPVHGRASTGSPSVSRVVNRLPEACVLVTRSGRILAHTPWARKALGTIVGARLSDVTHDPPDQLATYLARCFGSRAFVSGDLRFSGPHGKPRTYPSCGAAVRWPGRGNGVLIILWPGERAPAKGQILRLERRIEALTREIRQQRIVEKELQRQEELAEDANRRRNESLAVMSHELRTPLHSIMGYLELLDRGVGGRLAPAHAAKVQRIRRATEHLSSIIQTSLTFSSLEAGTEEPSWEDADILRIASEARELVAPAAAEKQISSSLQGPAKPIRLRTDPGKVRQILVNLLSNGIKFTEAGQVTLAIRRERDWAIVEVEDTGAGIPDEDLERVFEPFCRGTHALSPGARGTGLGLTVSRRLARLLGGDVEVRSVSGAGSTFTLRLPLSDSFPHDEVDA